MLDQNIDKSRTQVTRDLTIFTVEEKGYGYHLRDIPRGELGKSSKMQEELHELVDAEQQANKIMALCELSDLYGAMEAYLEQQFPNVTMTDLQIMAHATKRAFQTGRRT